MQSGRSHVLNRSLLRSQPLLNLFTRPSNNSGSEPNEFSGIASTARFSRSVACHRVLVVGNILLHVFEFCRAMLVNRTLVSAAATCRAWNECALVAFWEEASCAQLLSTLVPLGISTCTCHGTLLVSTLLATLVSAQARTRSFCNYLELQYPRTGHASERWRRGSGALPLKLI